MTVYFYTVAHKLTDPTSNFQEVFVAEVNNYALLLGAFGWS